MPLTITFELTDGTSLTIPQYQTTDEAIKYIEANTLWIAGGDTFSVRSNADMSWDKIPEAWTLGKKIQKIPGYKLVFGVMLTFPKKGNLFYVMETSEVNGGKILLPYENPENKIEAIYVNADISDFVKKICVVCG